MGSGLRAFLACLKFSQVNEFHQKDDVPDGFLRNSHKYHPQNFRDSGLVYIALYLLKDEGQREGVLTGSSEVGKKCECLLSKLHSFPPCSFLLIISSDFLGIFSNAKVFVKNVVKTVPCGLC